MNPGPDPVVDVGRRPTRRGDVGRAARLASGQLACVNCHQPLPGVTSSPYCDPCRSEAHTQARRRHRTRTHPLQDAALHSARNELLTEPHTSGDGWVAGPGGVYLDAALARAIRVDLGAVYWQVRNLEQRANRAFPPMRPPEVLMTVAAIKTAIGTLAERTAAFDPPPPPLDPAE